MGIIILHGWSTKVTKWDPFLKATGGKLLKIPGLTEKISKPWTLDNYVEWLNKKIGRKATIIGHSNGGRIALAFVAKYPEKIEKLILIDSAGIYHKEFTIRLKRLIFKGVAKLGKKITKSNTMKNIIYRLAGESDYNSSDPTAKQTMINLISIDLTSILNKINTPTLIIWGKNDKTTPLSDGRLMHRKIKGSVLKIVDARHSPQFTNVREVTKIINDYI